LGNNSATDAATAAVDYRRAVGFATSTSDRRCVATFAADAAASSNLGSMARNDAVIATIDGSGAMTGLVDLNSITSDGFTLIVDDTLPVNLVICWEAWGGSDITVAACVDIAEPAATGDVDYTVTGFTAGATNQVVMFAGVQCTAALNTGAGTDSGLCVGFATGASSAQCVLMGNSDDASNTMDTEGYVQDGECLAMSVVAGGSVNARASLTQFGTNNFRLNWAARGLTDRRYIGLGIKGGGWSAGSLTIDSTGTTNTASVSGLSFTPKGVSMFGRDAAENAAGTIADEDRMSLGTASSTSSRRSQGAWDEHNIADSETNLCIEYDQVLVFPTGAGAVDSAYDISAFNSDGFTVIVDDAPASGSATSWQGYLTFGDAAAAGAIEGTTTVAFNTAGVLVGSGALVGTLTATFAPSATLVGAGALLGTTALAFTVEGAMLSIGVLAGTSDLTIGPTGTVVGAGALVGTSVLTILPAATLVGAGALLGTSDLTITPVGVMTGDAPLLVGTATLTLEPTATLVGTGVLAGTSDLAFSLTGFMGAPGEIAGAVSLLITPAGTLVGAGALAGTAALLVTPEGTLGGSAALSATGELTFAPTGTVAGSASIAGTVSTVFTLSGVLADLSQEPEAFKPAASHRTITISSGRIITAESNRTITITTDRTIN
jgi:hypothetical protein